MSSLEVSHLKARFSVEAFPQCNMMQISSESSARLTLNACEQTAGDVAFTLPPFEADSPGKESQGQKYVP